MVIEYLMSRPLRWPWAKRSSFKHLVPLPVLDPKNVYIPNLHRETLNRVIAKFITHRKTQERIETTCTKNIYIMCVSDSCLRCIKHNSY
jgi:hypothetical protein